MIYGIISYFRSLLFLGFLVGGLFVAYLEILSKSYLEELNLLYFMLCLSSMLITAVYIITPPPNNLKNQQAYFTLGC